MSIQRRDDDDDGQLQTSTERCIGAPLHRILHCAHPMETFRAIDEEKNIVKASNLPAAVRWALSAPHSVERIGLCADVVKELDRGRSSVPSTTSTSRRRGPREEEKYTRLDWNDHVASQSSKRFRRRYRMDLGCFNSILSDIRPILGKWSWSHRRGEPILPEHQLAITLRMLAGASYLDCAVIFRVAESTVYRIFWRVVTAICNKYEITQSYDLEELKRLEGEFRSRSEKQVLAGCVGCIDGLLIKIRQPSDTETAHPKRYYSRKCFHAINIQAVCDVHGRFTTFEARGPGSMSDKQVWKLLDLYRDLEVDKKMPPGFWIAGDAAYPCTEHMIGPYTGNATEEQDSFNWAQSQLRIRIEMAFGKYVGRWGILWRPLRMHHGRAVIVANCCAKLHNLIISHDLKNGEYYSDEAQHQFKRTPVQLARGGHCEMQADRSALRAAVARNRHKRRKLPSVNVMEPPVFGKDGAPLNLLNDAWNYQQSRRTSSLRESLKADVVRLGVKRPRTSSIYVDRTQDTH